jgi:outer membrane autotransporter protein
VLAFNRSDANTFAGAISGTGSVSQIGTGTTILTGDSTYTGGTTISAGTLQLGNGGTTGSIIGNVTDNSTLAFNRSDTVTFPGTISGTGGVSQIGSGMTILNANNTYTGPTNVLVGTLVVGDPSHTSAALSGGGVTTVAGGATLGGFGSVAGPVANNGTIAVGNALSTFVNAPTSTFTIGGDVTNSGLITLAGATPGNVLSVHGNYSSSNGTLVLNTELNAGGPLSNQFTDRLLINGNASGNTTVQVKPIGSGAFTSTGAPTPSSGISIIQVAGASSFRAFTLPGGYVAGGATSPFQYGLNAYGPSSPFGLADPSQSLVGNPTGHWDFRLQNVFVTPAGPVTPGTATLPPDARLAVAPQVPSYITAPTALFNAGFAQFDELHRRLGEIRDEQMLGLPQSFEVFYRAIGGTFNYTSQRTFTDFGFDSTQNFVAVQLGGSKIVLDDNAGTLRAGLAGSFGQLWFNPIAVDGQSNALFNTYNLYGIATYQARAGWYIDAIVSGGYFNGTVDTATRGQAATPTGTSIATSIEGGYLIPLGWQRLLAEPEFQLVYQHLNFTRFTDVDGLIVNEGSSNQAVARVGGRLLRPFQMEDGKFVTPTWKLICCKVLPTPPASTSAASTSAPGNMAPRCRCVAASPGC